MVVVSAVWEPGTKPGPSAGREGGCDGVRCGSGSLSDEVDEELEEDEDDELGGALLGVRSLSGSSRIRLAGRAILGPGRSDDCEDCPGSLGGGSSTCMWVAVLSSAGVGIAPRSTYRDPAIFCDDSSPESDSISYVRVSNEVAIRRCSGAARMRVPA